MKQTEQFPEPTPILPPRSIIAILKMLQGAQRHLRGIQHFNLVELDDLRRNCQRQRDNKDLRIAYILKETTEDLMKTQLIKGMQMEKNEFNITNI